MTDEQDKQSKDADSSGGLGAFVVGIAMAVGILYVSGWSLIWQQQIYSVEAFVLKENGFAVRFNDLYYGASFTTRLFDSPVISWLCLMVALGLTPVGFFFAGDDE